MAPSRPASRPLFVYGTLMAPEVLTVLLERMPPLCPARLCGHSRYSLPGRVYPGVYGGRGSEVAVPGQLLADLTEAEAWVLDMFEGDEYEKRPVEVEMEVVEAPSSTVLAEAYVLAAPPPPGAVEDGWGYAAFRRNHLGAYVDMCGRFRAHIERRSPRRR